MAILRKGSRLSARHRRGYGVGKAQFRVGRCSRIAAANVATGIHLDPHGIRKRGARRGSLAKYFLARPAVAGSIRTSSGFAKGCHGFLAELGPVLCCYDRGVRCDALASSQARHPPLATSNAMQPAKLAQTPLIVGLVLFGVITVVWVLVLFRRFGRIP